MDSKLLAQPTLLESHDKAVVALAKIEAPRARSADDIYVEVVEAIVSVKIEPFKLKFDQVALEMDVCGTPHREPSICQQATE